MDELVYPASSCSSPSPTSFSAAGHFEELEFVSWDVPEEWMEGNDWFDEPLADGDEGCRSAGNGDLSGSGEPPAPAPAPKRRGRKPGPRTNGPTISHVEAERQRRDKLNRRFYELRAAVPTVSRMDRASLLADAAAYIGELRDRVDQLEAEAKQAASAAVTTAAAAAATHHHPSFGLLQGKLGLEVRMLAGLDAHLIRQRGARGPDAVATTLVAAEAGVAADSARTALSRGGRGHRRGGRRSRTGSRTEGLGRPRGQDRKGERIGEGDEMFPSRTRRGWERTFRSHAEGGPTDGTKEYRTKK